MHAIQSVAIGILANRSTYDWTIVPPGQGALFQSLPYMWSIPFCTLHFRINHCKFMSSNKYKYASVSAGLIWCCFESPICRLRCCRHPIHTMWPKRMSPRRWTVYEAQESGLRGDTRYDDTIQGIQGFNPSIAGLIYTVI